MFFTCKMFVQYKFIDPNHHVALQSCIRNHPIVTAQLLARIYNAALACVDKPCGETGLLLSHIKADTYQIGTATDEKTGIFVQLVKMKDRPSHLLTAGQKWAVERDNAVQGNTSTLLW